MLKTEQSNNNIIEKKVSIKRQNAPLSNKTQSVCDIHLPEFNIHEMSLNSPFIELIVTNSTLINKEACAKSLAHDLHNYMVNQKNQIRRYYSDSKNPNSNYDIIMIGAGIHSSIFNLNYRKKNPHAKIISIDSSKVLAEQFLSSDFLINSPEINGTNTIDPITGLPAATKSSNIFPNAPVQLADLGTASDKFYVSEKLWQVFIFNQFISNSDILLDSNVSKIQYDKDTKVFKVYLENIGFVTAKKVIISNGLGTPKFENFKDPNFRDEQIQLAKECADKNCLPQVMTFDDALRINHIWKKNGKNILNKFIHANDIAVIGSGDAANVFVEFLYKKAPNSAYQNLNTGYTIPNSNQVHWFAQKNQTGNEYITDPNVKARYKDFRRQFYLDIFDQTQYNLKPNKNHATSFEYDKTTKLVKIVDSSGSMTQAKYVIFSTGYTNSVGELISPILGKNIAPTELKNNFDNIEENNTAIARKLKISNTENIELYVIGTAAGTSPEWSLANKNDLDNSMTKNSASINVLAPKTAKFAEIL